MSYELAFNFCMFFTATTFGASLFGIAVDRGVSWYRDGGIADTEF